MLKKELRKFYKEKRLALSFQEILKLDDLLLIQFQRLAFNGNVEWVMSYLPIPGKAEIDPHLFVASLQLLLPDLKTTYPVIAPADCSMQPFWVDDDTVFKENELFIQEPVNGKQVDIARIDVVFVPLLAFDKKGYRVGYGKGFYDRFLSLCHPDVIAIGFSYFPPVDEITDTNQFDIPLNYCITPQQLYEF